MLEPVAFDSVLSRRIISMLEGPQVEISKWQSQLTSLEHEHGDEVYRHLFYVIGHLDLTPQQAKSYWAGAHGTWMELASQSGCPIDVRLAVLRYLLQRTHELRKPTVVEIELLQRAEESAVRDDLTGLHNYRYFRERGAQELLRATRHSYTLSLLMIDVDDFKLFNDRFGHVAGNAALVRLAKVLAESVRGTDIASRYGGEEFALLLPSTSRAGAVVVAEKIHERVCAENISGAAGTDPLTVSIGLASYPGDSQGVEELVQRADAGLYLAKAAGKNCTRCASAERRESPRYAVRLEGCLWLLGEDRLPVVTRDVSHCGISFEIDRELSVGSVVQIELSPPDGVSPLSCTCRVVRVGSAGPVYRVGTQILHVEPLHGFQFRTLIAGLSTSSAPLS